MQGTQVRSLVWSGKIPHAVEQLSPCVPRRPGAGDQQQAREVMAMRSPMQHN